MVESLFEECGLLATYIGTLLEGEIMLLTSVISAKLGLFNYQLGLVAAFLGAYTKAWIKFIIVKKQGAKILAKKPKLKEKLDKASGWFNKRPYMFLSVYKFLYGMASIIVILSGLRNMSYLRFGIHAAIAIGIWVVVFGGFAFFCAEMMLENINAIADKKWYLIGVLVTIGIAVWFFKHRPVHRHYMKVKE